MNIFNQYNLPMSETAALRDIFNWSLKRPNWQRDALRRLIVYDDLTAIDIDQLFTLCLNENAEFEPLQLDHIAPESEGKTAIALKSIHHPKGINALPVDQILEFGRTGLTLVYGDNGSGKSGYCRILKHACRSRAGKVKILPDIDKNSDAAQSAIIEFWIGEEKMDTVWSPEGDHQSILQSISVFDSDSANVHVQKTNAVAYTPFPMRLLEKLATLSDTIKDKIDKEKEILVDQTPKAILSPEIDAHSEAGKFLYELNAKSTPEELDRLTNFTAQEELRYAILQTDLSQDPEKAIKRLQFQHKALSEYLNNINAIVNATSHESVSQLATLKKLKNDKETLAKATSEELFATSPLPNIGGNLWTQLWEAARTYSDKQANPDKSFPNELSSEDLCVLCQQTLSDDAVSRFKTFESFMKDTTSRDAAQARSDYDKARTDLATKRISASTFRQIVRTIDNEMGQPHLAKNLRRAAIVARWRLRHMLKDIMPNVASVSINQKLVEEVLNDLETRINQLSADKNSEKRLTLEAELRELKDRKFLQTLRADLKEEMKRIARRSELEGAVKRTAKQSITKKNKELSNNLVTESLRNRFAREVQKLEIGSAPLELVKQKDRNAQSFFQIQFVNRPDIPVSNVLSEGEHRCVALAAFLAELVTSSDKSGIAFDDPLSSLDHLYRTRVAHRLVEEAAHRQVVVFTHDLTFLIQIDKVAKQMKFPTVYRTVRRKHNNPGYIETDLTSKGKTANKMIDAIRSEVKRIRGNFDSWPSDRREITAKGIKANLREAWEQVIADFLEPVISRFDNHVKPGVLHKLTVLTEADALIVKRARTRLSEVLHYSSETLNPAEVEFSDLDNEARCLWEFYDDLKRRQTEAAEPQVGQLVTDEF